MPTTDEVAAAMERLRKRKSAYTYAALVSIYPEPVTDYGNDDPMDVVADLIDDDCQTLADAYPALLADRDRLAKACAETEHEVQQILGRALRYPRYADDPVTFPDATDADGVFVGENVAATLAMEMVAERDRLAGQLAKCHRMLRYVYNGCATPLGSYEVKNLLVSHGILPEESP